MTDVTFERTSPNRRMVSFMEYLPGEMRACFSDAQQSPEFTYLAPTVGVYPPLASSIIRQVFYDHRGWT